MRRKKVKYGEICPISGHWEIVGPVGARTGDERAVTEGEPFSPTPEPSEKFILADEH